MSKLFRATYRWGVVAMPGLAACCLWELLVMRSDRWQFLFGSPLLVLSSLFTYVVKGSALVDLLITGAEAVGGFVVGNALGLVVGLGLAYYPRVQNIAKWYIAGLGAIPIFSLAPMMIMWFGVGYFAKLMMAVFSTFFVTAVQAYTGATQVDKNYMRLMASLGATDRQAFIKVAIPSSISFVVASFRLTIGFALLGAFVGEFISADKGLGYRILKSGGLYDIPGVLSGIVLIIVLAIFLNICVDKIGQALMGRTVVGTESR